MQRMYVDALFKKNPKLHWNFLHNVFPAATFNCGGVRFTFYDTLTLAMLHMAGAPFEQVAILIQNKVAILFYLSCAWVLSSPLDLLC